MYGGQDVIGTVFSPHSDHFSFVLSELYHQCSIVLYCSRVPAANAPGCTAAEGLLCKPWSLVVLTYTARDPSSEGRNYLGEKWPMNVA